MARVACRGVLWGVASATGHYCRRGPYKVERRVSLTAAALLVMASNRGVHGHDLHVTWPSRATAWGQQSLRWVAGCDRLLVASPFDCGPLFKGSMGPQSSVVIISYMPPEGSTEESY